MSTALAAFEDAGFYCVDNMPVVLLPNFLDLTKENAADFSGFVFVMDLREKGFTSKYRAVFQALHQQGFQFEVIFLEAHEDVLLQRYSQTRRNHPLSRGKDLLASIRAEEELLIELREEADKIIDTSNCTAHDLKSIIFNIIQDRTKLFASIKINVLSFGFKYGIPRHADLVMDVRCLPNPYFVSGLKAMSGESEPVISFVLEKPETKTFLKKYLDMLDYLLPLYEKEGKAYLTIAVGCTGGRHRSVVISKQIYDHISKFGKDANLTHRDIDHENV
jgi:UPF0042 nucleotide-binding protein